MPREYEKRGRRAQTQKRKLQEEVDENEYSKRQRILGVDDDQCSREGFLDASYNLPAGGTDAFFGLLDLNELEYFRHADSLLEANSFPSIEERELFLQNVMREAHGKALKLATSPPCSRLLEKLINVATDEQFVHLYQELRGQYVALWNLLQLC